MKRAISLCIAALALVVGNVPACAQRATDMRKAIIETPLKTTINPSFQPDSKAEPVAPLIEERVVSVTDKGVAKVKPGDVSWRADFDGACAAARKSGKAVLLFAMLGSLDDKFC